MSDEGSAERVATIALDQASDFARLQSLLEQFGFDAEDLRGLDQTGLDDLSGVVVEARYSHGLTDVGTVLWMRHRNRLLTDHAPLEVLRAGGKTSVINALRCFVDVELPFTSQIEPEVLDRLPSMQ